MAGTNIVLCLDYWQKGVGNMMQGKSLGVVVTRWSRCRLAATCGLAAAVCCAAVSSAHGQCPSSFAAAVNYGTGNSPRSVAIGDLNGDGRPDLAVATSG